MAGVAEEASAARGSLHHSSKHQQKTASSTSIWRNNPVQPGENSTVSSNPGRNTMSGMIQRTLAAARFAFICIALPASAQETLLVRGTIERVAGPVYVL